ncbi:copper oxidase, partial [Micrococcus sp. SIMBA_144]
MYEFDAEPMGMHVYHCHAMPLKKHIEKGLYGTFIIDPKEPRPKAKEMVMVMNGFDTNFDGGNEFYTVNGVANYHLDHP